MKIKHKQIGIGIRVRLTEDVEMHDCIYTKGHEFNVIGEGERGFDLEDDDGNQLFETRLMNHKLKIIN